MVQESKIEWCSHTSNPVKYRDADGRVVWACVKKSSGCANCYAEALAVRYGRGGPFTKPVMSGLTPFVDEKELRELLSPRKLPAGSKCFVGDMTDVFGEWVPFEELDRLFAVFALRPDVVFQVLTKRPERMREYCRAAGTAQNVFTAAGAMNGDVPPGFSWPLPNVWLGTSVEDQVAADERIPQLMQTPAALRFLSVEPLVGPVTLALDGRHFGCACPTCEGCGSVPVNNNGDILNGWDFASGGAACPTCPDASGVLCPDWVIVGGESGPGARACDLEWLLTIVRQCRRAATPVFVKQLGSNSQGFIGPVEPYYEGRRDSKGGNPEAWPNQLRVREWPDA